MRLLYRLLIAIPMALLFIWLGIQVYFPGLMLGGLLTDSCSGVLGGFWWLTYVWPFVLAAGILIPSLLVLANVKWYKVLIALGVIPIVSGACLLMWFPILWVTCK